MHAPDRNSPGDHKNFLDKRLQRDHRAISGRLSGFRGWLGGGSVTTILTIDVTSLAFTIPVPLATVGSLTHPPLTFGGLPSADQHLALRMPAELLVPPPRCVMILTPSAQTFTLHQALDFPNRRAIMN